MTVHNIVSLYRLHALMTMMAAGDARAAIATTRWGRRTVHRSFPPWNSNCYKLANRLSVPLVIEQTHAKYSA